ncbi:MAG: hypothetical protein COB59_07270 [Rhodospirillaceae bacterium]|nr:MAG: hypothetical protein COB59_07270 [Rhodospirillaceae bacterium]
MPFPIFIRFKNLIGFGPIITTNVYFSNILYSFLANMLMYFCFYNKIPQNGLIKFSGKLKKGT